MKKIGNQTSASLNAITGDLLIYVGQGDTLTWDDLARRHQLRDPTPDNLSNNDNNQLLSVSDSQQIIERLIRTNRMQRYPLVVHRLRD